MYVCVFLSRKKSRQSCNVTKRKLANLSNLNNISHANELRSDNWEGRAALNSFKTCNRHVMSLYEQSDSAFLLQFKSFEKGRMSIHRIHMPWRAWHTSNRSNLTTWVPKKIHISRKTINKTYETFNLYTIKMNKNKINLWTDRVAIKTGIEMNSSCAFW